jgi:DNA-binding transcriptional MerR regulator
MTTRERLGSGGSSAGRQSGARSGSGGGDDHSGDGGGPGALPTKLYFRIGEVAHALGLETHVLRYWETEFRSIRPQKSARGQRVYSRRDVETLARVKELLYERGFTIAGARKHLRDGGVEPREPTDPALRGAARMRNALLELRQEIVALMDDLGS